MIVTTVLLYAMMVPMRDVKKINEVKPKAIISVDLVSEQERWIRGPISQKK
jgi:anaerobic C4-dicarboxylate transporter